LIDGTLIKIHKPWNNVTYKTWFNEHKKIYSMNNIICCSSSKFVHLPKF
jgi:hypothetical protein